MTHAHVTCVHTRAILPRCALLVTAAVDDDSVVGILTPKDVLFRALAAKKELNTCTVEQVRDTIQPTHALPAYACTSLAASLHTRVAPL